MCASVPPCDTPKVRRLPLLCAALTLAAGSLGACGRSGGQPAQALAKGDFVDARTVDQKLADFAIADGGLVRLADLPAGWEMAVGGEDPAADAALLDCVKPPHRDVVENREAMAQRALRSGDIRADSAVDVYPDEAYAKEAFSIVRDARFPECYRATLEQALRAGLVATEGQLVDVSVQVQRLPDPTLGDEGAALRLDTVLSGPGGQRHSVIDVLGVRVGRVETDLTLMGAGAPFDFGLGNQLLHLTVERVAKR
jgi:hypothetical protein